MNKQKEIEHVIKKHMKYRVTQDEFVLQGDKVYVLAQEILKLFTIPINYTMDKTDDDVSLSVCTCGCPHSQEYLLTHKLCWSCGLPNSKL